MTHALFSPLLAHILSNPRHPLVLARMQPHATVTAQPLGDSDVHYQPVTLTPAPSSSSTGRSLPCFHDPSSRTRRQSRLLLWVLPCLTPTCRKAHHSILDPRPRLRSLNQRPTHLCAPPPGLSARTPLPARRLSPGHLPGVGSLAVLKTAPAVHPGRPCRAVPPPSPPPKRAAGLTPPRLPRLFSSDVGDPLCRGARHKPVPSYGWVFCWVTTPLAILSPGVSTREACRVGSGIKGPENSLAHVCL